jgi:hypothetical protein
VLFIGNSLTYYNDMPLGRRNAIRVKDGLDVPQR